MHCFELKTNNLEYYVGDNEQNSSVEANVENTGNSTLSKREKSWKSIIQHALMPVPSNSTSMFYCNVIQSYNNCNTLQLLLIFHFRDYYYLLIV